MATADEVHPLLQYVLDQHAQREQALAARDAEQWEAMQAAQARILAGEGTDADVQTIRSGGEQRQTIARERRQVTPAAVESSRVVVREIKADIQRQQYLRAPVAAGRAPLVERQRGASRERRSSRSSARSGDSGTDSDSSSSDPPPRARPRAGSSCSGTPP